MGLDTVELVMRIEEEFAITIADQDAEQLMTVSDLYDCIESKVLEKSTSEVNEEALFGKFIKIMVDQTGIDRAKIQLTASIVEDLGLD